MTTFINMWQRSQFFSQLSEVVFSLGYNSYLSTFAFQAEGLGKNPLYLMFPTAIATSFAFMLPVATPPNAIAFSYGRITVLDMVSVNKWCKWNLAIKFFLSS